jgi:SAM-dependent methyltransferase
MLSVLDRGIGAGRRMALRVRGRPSARHALVGPAHLWAMKRRFQFEFLTSRGLQPHQRLLDLGCGTLRGGIPLICYLQAGHYVGVEARAEVLQEARRELAEAGLEHKRPLLIRAAAPAQVRLEVPVDFAWAFSVLIHMPDALVASWLQFIAAALGERGEFYANVIIGHGQRGEWQGFPVLARPQESYGRLAGAQGLVVEDLGPLGALGHLTGSSQDRQVMLRFTRAGG